MIQAEWKNKITETCKEAGTYRPFFDEIINQLAQILEIRDNAVVDFRKSGNSPVVIHTNKGGHSNVVKNPALVVINECNQQALAYWKELGLTVRGYASLQGRIEIDNKQDEFSELLERVLK